MDINIVIAFIVILTIHIIDLPTAIVVVVVVVVAVWKGLAALLKLLSTTDYQQAGSCFQRDFASSLVFSREDRTPMFIQRTKPARVEYCLIEGCSIRCFCYRASDDLQNIAGQVQSTLHRSDFFSVGRSNSF